MMLVAVIKECIMTYKDEQDDLAESQSSWSNLLSVLAPMTFLIMFFFFFPIK